MKTTVEIDDRLFRSVKATAAEKGISLKTFFEEALSEKLIRSRQGADAPKPWMRAFGGLRDLHRDNLRVRRIIDTEFNRVDPEEWR